MPASVLTGAAVPLMLLTAVISSQRDVRQYRTGTAVVSGVVLIDDRDARPLRRARVVLGGDGSDGRTAITEDNGSFQFTDVPSGRYRISVTRAGFVTTAFGASRPGRPGKRVVVTDGAKVSDIAIRVPRGAVISGVVLDTNSQPLASATVRALRYAIENGERTLVSTHQSVTTDDRGEYRIYGLAAGEYFVVAGVRAVDGVTAGIQRVSNDDVTRAKLGRRASPESQRSEGPANAAANVRERPVKYAPVFYPGTNSVAHAVTVRVGAGEERTGVDIQAQFEPVAELSGTVSLTSDSFPFFTLHLIETGRPSVAGITDIFPPFETNSSGQFRISDVPPGIYTLTAETATASRYWAQTELVVNGDDIPGIALVLQPTMTFSGRIRAERPEAAPDFTKARIMLSPAESNRVTRRIAPAQISANGTFAIAGVAPGRYRMRVTAVDSKGSTWVPLSATVEGRDLLDLPIEIRAGQSVANAEVTFTDRPTELSGSLRDASGQVLTDGYVIVFAIDRTFWTAQTRRIAASEASPDGRYTFRNLPPGEYLVAIVDDVENGEWFDPEFLESLSSAAVKVVLGASERKMQDLTGR